MIREPYYVSPYNETKDVSDGLPIEIKISTNNAVTAYKITVYDYSTNQVVYETDKISLSTPLYNNEVLKTTLTSEEDISGRSLSNGEEYYWKARLYESVPSTLIASGKMSKETTSLENFTHIFVPLNPNISKDMYIRFKKPNEASDTLTSIIQYDNMEAFDWKYGTIYFDYPNPYFYSQKMISLPTVYHYSAGGTIWGSELYFGPITFLFQLPNSSEPQKIFYHSAQVVHYGASTTRRVGFSPNLPSSYPISEQTTSIENVIGTTYDYEVSMGTITIAEALESPLPIGTDYQVLTDYIDTPTYYLKTKEIPIISSITISNENNGELNSRELSANAIYIPSNYTPINYHIWSLYDNNDGKIIASDKRYSANLQYFYNTLEQNREYNLELKITDVDNQSTTLNKVFTCVYNPESITVNLSVKQLYDKNAVEISWNSIENAIHYNLYKKNVTNGAFSKICSLDAVQDTYVVDHNLKNNTEYMYFIEVIYSNEVKKSESVNITTDWRGYSITAISPSEDEEKKYIAHDVFMLLFNVENSEYQLNKNNSIVNSISKFPKVIMSDNSYITGNISAFFGGVNDSCEYEEDRETFNMLREYIDNNSIFLFKNIKGNSFIVTINDYSFKFDDQYSDRPTTIAFSYTQIDSTEDKEIYETYE